jgi:hypothetical protein
MDEAWDLRVQRVQDGYPSLFGQCRLFFLAAFRADDETNNSGPLPETAVARSSA